MKTDRPVYEIKNFAFTYPLSYRRVEIKGNISIFKGERVLIKGPSGCGKSTLMLAMRGLIPHEIYGKLQGTVLFYNKPIALYSNTALTKKIGIVFQNPYTQNITNSVEEELIFLLENLNCSKREIDKRLRETIHTFHLQSLLRKRKSELSGGELQKIVLASVLIGKPEVLLLDEPASYLDVMAEYAFYAYLDLIEKSTTVIAIDHKLHRNRRILGRIIELEKKGRILYDGPIEHWRKRDTATRSIPPKQIELLPTRKNVYTGNGICTIRVKNLSFAYTKGIDVLKGIDLTLRAGRIVSIFGLNGSGKTTLLKVIAKLLKSRESKILVNDQSNIPKSVYYRNIGVVFQNPESHFLFPTVEAEIEKGRENRDGISSMLALFKLQKLRFQNPFTLSEGEKRRLNLVQAFSGYKKIILLDEPTFGQDEENTLLLKEMMLILKANGTGFLIITHDLQFIADISDEIYRLKNGRLKEVKNLREK